MKTMICKQIISKEIMGVTLIDAVWESSTGRVQATNRCMTMNQYEIGVPYVGTLSYDAANERRFSPKFKK